MLFEGLNNDHQFYGFGVGETSLRYQVNTTGDSHIFYAGSSAISSNELMRLQGNGSILLSDGNANISFNSNDTFIGIAGAAGYHFADANAGDFAVRSKTGKRVLIGPPGLATLFVGSGTLGIGGETTSGRHFQLNAANPFLRINANDGGEPNLEFSDGGSIVAGEYWQAYKNRTDNSLRLFNGVDRFYFTPGGRLGIGAIPSYHLDVLNSAAVTVNVSTSGNAQSGVRIARTGSTPGAWEFYMPQGSEDMRLYRSGLGDRFFFTPNGYLGGSEDHRFKGWIYKA